MNFRSNATQVERVMLQPKRKQRTSQKVSVSG
jgi:hypothetical protein